MLTWILIAVIVCLASLTLTTSVNGALSEAKRHGLTSKSFSAISEKKWKARKPK